MSVHGANRLGSNSLTDLVVFGRAAGLRCGETVERGRGACRRCRRMPTSSRCPGSTACRHAKGGTPTAALRLQMQKAMQNNCAVFRTGEVLEEGVAKITEIWSGSDDIARLRPLADLELRPDRDAGVREPDRAGRHHGGQRRQPQGEPRRARARGLPGARRRQLDEAHAGVGRPRDPHACASTTAPCTPTP